MADLILTAMIPPAFDTTYDTIDGTPYRCSAADKIVYVQPQHINELSVRGFVPATSLQMPAGDPALDDVGWSVQE